MSSEPSVIHWFRQDLRLADNPALRAAFESGRRVIVVYVLDDGNAGDRAPGRASRWWLHESLNALNSQIGGQLVFRRGDARKVIPQLAVEARAQAVYWNRCYEPWRIERDKAIKAALKDKRIDAESYNASLLYEPWTVLKDDGDPYRVFTPFYKRCLAAGEPEAPLDEVDAKAFSSLPYDRKGKLEDLDLLPDKGWYKKFAKYWTPGEAGAQQRLRDFLDEGLPHYKQGRNRPDKPYVSRLSPHLHFGEIPPRQVWHDVKTCGAAQGCESAAESYNRELVWREFSYNLLYHFPHLPHTPLQQKLEKFLWAENDEALERWQKGRTGYPVVDAGMRELWETGYMHNRVRMIVGSFLVKDLLLHWRHGEKWFWDTLVDADLANNSASWQWVAGCGADAAPFFRIFNPVTQGKKFDPDGDYVRQWVPELKDMPDKFLHDPWEAPQEVLQNAGIALGQTYPQPIVDHKDARKRALAAFEEVKNT